jgi:predicted permease
MQTLISSLLPICLVIALGAGLRASGFLSEGFFAGMNRLCYWIALPVLLVHKLAGASLQGESALRICAALIIATVGCVLVGYAAALAIRLPSRSLGAFVQSAFRGNLVYVGLPVILYSLAPSGGPSGDSVQSTAIVAVAPLIAVYNMLSVLVLSLHGSHENRPPAARVIKQIATNPLIVACLIGMALCLSGVTLPSVANRTLQLVGQVALPLALLAIGSSLTLDRIRGNLVASIVATTIKVAVAPSIGYGIAVSLGLAESEMCIALVYLACPTAAVSYIMAGQLGGDEVLSGSAVVLSTIASLASLSVVVYLFA